LVSTHRSGRSHAFATLDEEREQQGWPAFPQGVHVTPVQTVPLAEQRPAQQG
jgi:hypothetical protein